MKSPKKKSLSSFSCDDLPMPVIIHRKDNGQVVKYNKVAKRLLGLPTLGSKPFSIGKFRPGLLPTRPIIKSKDFVNYGPVFHRTSRGKDVTLTVLQKKITWKNKDCFIDFLEQPVENQDHSKKLIDNKTDEGNAFSSSKFSDVLFFGKMGKAELDLKTFLIELSVELLLLLDIDASSPQTIPLNDFLRIYVHPDFQIFLMEKISGGMIGAKDLEKVVDAEFAMVTAKGRKIWIEGKGFFKGDLAVGILHDVTERKAAGQKLQDAMKLFDRLSENIPGMLFKFSINSEGLPCFHFASKGALELFGIRGNELEEDARLMLQNIYPEDLAKQMPQLRHAYFAGQSWHEEFRVVRPDGSTKWVTVSSHAYQEGANNFWYGFMHDVTERKNAERIIAESYTALEAERDKFHSLVSDIDGIVWEADAQTFQFSFVSQQAEKILGYPVSNWLSDAAFWPRIIHWEDRERVVDYCIKCTNELRDHDFEYRITRKDGKVVWVHDQVTVIQKDEKPSLLRGIMIDITQSKLDQKKLEASERMNRSIIENSLEGILFSNSDGKILSANPEACKLLRMTEEEICLSGREGVVDMSRSNMSAILKQRDETGFYRGEITMRRKDGELFSAEISSKIFVGSDGELHSTTIFRDVQKRKNMEQELMLVKNNLRAILNASTDAICFLDGQGRILEANTTARKVMSAVLKKELILGDRLVNLMPETARENFNNKFDRALKGEITEQETEQFIDEISIGWFRSRFLPVKDESGNILGVSFDVIDITPRKQAEFALKNSEEKFRSIVNHSGEGILYTSPDGRIFSANMEACRIFEMTEAEICVVGRNGLIDRSDPTKPHTIGDGEGFFHGELQMKRSSGEVFTAEITSKVFVDPRGELKTTLIVRDITERKKIENDLRDREILLKGVLDSTNDGILAVGSNGKVINYNNRLGQLWQMPKKWIDSNDDDNKLIGFVLNQLIDPEAFLLKVRELYSSDATSFDLLQFKDGRIFERYSTPLLLNNTNVGRVWSFRDITERNTLHKEIEKLAMIASHTSSLAILTDVNHRITWVNDGFEKVTGYTKEEVMGKKPGSFLQGPETDRATIQIMHDALKKNNGFKVEILNYTKTGKKYWLDIEVMPVLDENKKLTGFMAIQSDITQLKMAIDEMLNSQVRLHTMMDRAPMVVFMKDTQKRYIFFNHAYEKVFEQVKLKLGDEDQLDIFDQQDDEVLETTVPVSFEQKIGDRHFFTTKFPISDHLGKVYGIGGISLDISERKAAENQLLRSKTEYQRLVQTIPVGVFKNGRWPNGKSRMLYVSPRWCSLNGVDHEEVMENFSTVLRTIHPDDFPAFMEIGNAALENETDFFWEGRRIINNTVRYIHIESSPEKLESGEVIWNGIEYDITERKNAELGLLKMLAEKESLIKEIHHRVKNNLQLISSVIYIRMKNMKQSHLKDFLEDTRQKIRSIALIHERLLQTGAVNEVDISDYLGKLIADLHMSSSRSDLTVTIQSKIDSEKLNLDVAINCGLILNELATNSIKHAFVGRQKGLIDVSFHKNGKGYEMKITDDGVMIPESVSVGQSGSFGMQMLDIFIKQLGGSVKINRTNGTEFIIFFSQNGIGARS